MVYDVVLYSKGDAKKRIIMWTGLTLKAAKRWVARLDADEFVIERRVVK